MGARRRGVIDYLLRPRAIIRNYRREHLRGDMIAGLTVGVMLLPQGIAYAQIAELPPEFGLHAGIVGRFQSEGVETDAAYRYRAILRKGLIGGQNRDAQKRQPTDGHG